MKHELENTILTNDKIDEINMLLPIGNRVYFALHKILKSKLVSRRSKISIHQTIIIPRAKHEWKWKSSKNIRKKNLLKKVILELPSQLLI